MKITMVLSLALLSAGSTSAFATMLPRATSLLQFSKMKSQQKANLSKGKPVTRLFSDNPIDRRDDPSTEQIKARFLCVDVEQSEIVLAKNWPAIATTGFVTMALGIAALYQPIVATGVAYLQILITIGAFGLLNFMSAFVRENGHKTTSALSGAGYMGLAWYMYTQPEAGLDVITVTIASVMAAEGLYETILASRNEKLAGRPWHFLSGIASIAAGIFVASKIPASSLLVPGVALAVRLLTAGATKVAVGFVGKALADDKIDKSTKK